MPEQSEGMVRRKFLKQAGLGTAAVAASGSLFRQIPLSQELQAARMSSRQAVVFLLGDTLIPSEPGDPGYREMEWYGITGEVMKGMGDLNDEDFETFNRESSRFFAGKSFLDLDESQRAEYLNRIIAGDGFADGQLLDALQSLYRRARVRIFSLFYRNFPEHLVPRDVQDVPITRPGDDHQITNPNTSNLVTAWDTTGFGGPLRWEEEEERRSFFKQVHWQE